jgi:hypothetical protein
MEYTISGTDLDWRGLETAGKVWCRGIAVTFVNSHRIHSFAASPALASALVLNWETIDEIKQDLLGTSTEPGHHSLLYTAEQCNRLLDFLHAHPFDTVWYDGLDWTNYETVPTERYFDGQFYYNYGMAELYRVVNLDAVLDELTQLDEFAKSNNIPFHWV